MHSKPVLGWTRKAVLRFLKPNLKQLKKAVENSEDKLLILVKWTPQNLQTPLENTPGIVRKTALMVIDLTCEFDHFFNAIKRCI